jgi:hypothetical protein
MNVVGGGRYFFVTDTSLARDYDVRPSRSPESARQSAPVAELSSEQKVTPDALESKEAKEAKAKAKAAAEAAKVAKEAELTSATSTMRGLQAIDAQVGLLSGYVVWPYTDRYPSTVHSAC